MDVKVQKYTIIGNKTLVLTKNKKLKFIDGENVEFSISGIDDYIYNGNLITLSKDGIYYWEDMNTPNKIEVKKFNHIIGINENTLYIDNYDNKKLNILSINIHDKKCSVLKTFDKEIIVHSYLKNTNIEYLEYSKMDEDSKNYYTINNFENLIKVFGDNQ